MVGDMVGAFALIWSNCKMKTIRYFLWNVCDHAAPNYMVAFKACAWFLALLGDDYWKNSVDYREAL